jgi:hypothetical protein
MATQYLRRVWHRLKVAPLPLQIGFVGTALWGLWLAIYVASGDRRDGFWKLALNDMGDFLSGAFAPLAFLWLVVAVLLQKDELGLQREELRQSREALEAQAAETRALVEQNKLSVEVATKTLEQQQLREREARLHQVIDALGFRILSLADFAWIKVGGSTSTLFGKQQHLRELIDPNGGRDAVIATALRQMWNCVDWVEKQNASLPRESHPALANELRMLLERFRQVQSILEKEPELETIQVRAYAIDLAGYVPAIENVLRLLSRAKHEP